MDSIPTLKYRIATWNLDRTSRAKISNTIKSKIQEINADIFVLTETSELIDLSSDYFSIKSQEFRHF